MGDPVEEPALDVAVVMACYTADRWPSIVDALESLRRQTLRPRQVIVGVDNEPTLASRIATEFDWVDIAINDGDRGASTTRNRAVELVLAQYTAFLDDDEIAYPDWLFELTRPFADAGVVGTGGRYLDTWTLGRPAWFPPEFAWAVGGAYAGMPTVTSEVRNVWSGSMAVRTHAFRAVGGFRTDFGKRGQASQPEDTDLCIRVAQASGGRWLYVPSAVILHDVPAARSSLRFFATRCYTEGAGKALMSQHFDATDVIGTERSYVLQTAMAAARRLATLRRDDVRQGLVMFLGLACAAGGYAVALTRVTFTRCRRTPAEEADRHAPPVLTPVTDGAA